MNKIAKKIIKLLYLKINNKSVGRKLKCDLDHYIESIYTVLKYALPWRSINTKLHYTSYHKFFEKLVSKNIFKTAYSIITNKYYKNINKRNDLFLDSSMIKNINGKDLLGKNHFDRNRKGNKITVLVDSKGIPISIHLAKANIHDSQLIEDILDSSTIKIIQSRIISDKGYINPKIKRKLKRRKVNLIYPYRKNQNIKNSTFEKNKLKERYIVENFFSWIKKYRRIQQRYDSRSIIYLNFIYFASIDIICNKIS